MKKPNLKKTLLSFALLLLGFFEAYSGVYISEIMPCNISTNYNDLYNFSGWAEFYNEGSKDVNLKGSNLTQYKKSGKAKWSWDIDKDIVVPAGAYKLIYFDKLDGSKHAPYKIDTDGGELRLTMSDGMEYSFAYPIMYPHLSYGVGGNGIVGYMEPTPGVTNMDAYENLSASRCAAPVFSKMPGVYDEATGTIALSSATPGAEIYYTKDGSEPTKEKGILYEEPIVFDKTRILRAKAFKEDMLSSAMLSGSFILYESSCKEGERAPVVSIIADDSYFYSDQMGIYRKGSNGVAGPKSCVSEKANYNRDWDRAANIEYFEKGIQKMSQEAEVAVMGGCSRTHEVKSLKLATSKKTGAKVFSYNVFENLGRAGNQYYAYQLRNGGNSYENSRFRDGFMQSIAKGMGNVDYQAYQPVAYYLNGKHLGLMGLRERSNKAFVFSNYGLDEDEIDVVELTSDGYEATEGDLVAYEKMIDYVSHHYSDDNYLSSVASLIDLDEYLNYMIFEQFIVNTDWPGNNSKLWRSRDGGKFRWILYDTDFGLGLFDASGPNYCDVNNNMIEWCMGVGSRFNWGNGVEYSGVTEATKWKTILFKSLMQNDEFKQMYLTKSLYHLEHALSNASIKGVWEELAPKIENEFCATSQLHYEDMDGLANSMIKFANERVSVVYKQLASFYDVKNELVKLKVSSSTSGVTFFVNHVETPDNNYSLSCLKGMDVHLSANLPDGYVVDKWTIGDDSYMTPSVDVKMDGAVTVILSVKKDSYKPTLFINEVCAKNTLLIDEENGETSDWIEIYNAEDVSVDVAGMYLSDDPDNPFLHQIARGFESTIIPAKGHLLLWADGRSDNGPLHLGFKLSDVSGETITLSKVVSGDIQTIDQLTFTSIGENSSYGRVEDGSSSLKVFTPCSFGDLAEWTPGAQNGTVDCESIILQNSVVLSLSASDPLTHFAINGSEVENPSNYLAWKDNMITINPVLPSDAEFLYWESSKPFPVEKPLLTSSSSWNYFYKDTMPEGEWNASDYDDSAWKSGNGRFGYASDSRKYDTKLSYGGDPDDKYLTGYFRTSFDVNGIDFDSLALSFVYDDGMVVYLNGEELTRSNLPKGEVSYETKATTYVDDKKMNLTIPKKSLNDGTNVLAVEVHQYNGLSSDFTFAGIGTLLGHTTRLMDTILSLVATEDMALKLMVNSPERTDCTPTLAEQKVTISPNPASEVTVVAAEESIESIAVYDLSGLPLMKRYPMDKECEINVSSLKSGVYLLKIQTAGIIVDKRLIVK